MSCRSYITVHRGLPFYEEHQWFQDEELTKPLNITGWKFFSWVKNKSNDIVFEFTITVLDGDEGVIAIQAPKEAASLCYEDLYYSDLLCYDADNKVVGVFPYEVVINHPIIGEIL